MIIRKKIAKLMSFILLLGAVSLYAAPLDNMANSKVSVGVVATEIAPANYKRKEITLYNDGSDVIYIDNNITDCTVADSYPIQSSVTYKLEGYQGAIWGIVATTTSTVRISEIQY